MQLHYSILFTKQPFHPPLPNQAWHFGFIHFSGNFPSFKNQIDLILNHLESSWVQSQSN